MRTRTLIGAGLAVALAAAAAWGYQSTASAQGWGMMGGYGPGYGHMGGYGPGMMGGYGPGYGHMGGWGRGDGPGAGQWNCPAFARGNGPGYGPQSSNQDDQTLNLTTDDVKTRMERWLAREDNPRLKLGDVKEKDADTITADIVTVDNSLVQRFEIDRHSGFTHPSGS